MFTILTLPAWAQNWDQGFEVLEPRENIYQLEADTFQKRINEGRKIALFYPVTVSELLIPYQPLKTFFESDPNDPVRKVLYDLARVVSPFKSMGDVFNWLGVHEFPATARPSFIPKMERHSLSDVPLVTPLIFLVLKFWDSLTDFLERMNFLDKVRPSLLISTPFCLKIF